MSRNADIDCILMHNFYFFYLFFRLLKNIFINMIAVLMMSAKMAILGLLKKTYFEIKIMQS